MHQDTAEAMQDMGRIMLSCRRGPGSCSPRDPVLQATLDLDSESPATKSPLRKLSDRKTSTVSKATPITENIAIESLILPLH